MKKTLIFLLSLSLAACAGSATKTYTLPNGLVDFSAAKQLACRFEKTIDTPNTPQTSNWYFWRQEHRTETHDELSNQGELWENSKPGEFFYTRLFYNEHVALEFTQSDLLATGAVIPSLQQLNSLVDPKTLGKELILQRKDNATDMAVEYYTGAINNIATEVDWLPALQLPARLVKKLPEGTLTLILGECGTGGSKFAVKPISKTELDNFRRFDYTDLGDMEDDPMVQHIEQLIGGHQHEH